MEAIQNQLAARMAVRYKERLDAMSVATCKICGKRFRRTKRTQKCCSKECSAENAKRIAQAGNEARKAARNRPKTIQCAMCGKEIPNSTSNRKYCEVCRIEANREHARNRLSRMSMLKILKPKAETSPTPSQAAEEYTPVIPNNPVRARLKVDPSSLPKPLLPPTKEWRGMTPEDKLLESIAKSKRAYRANGNGKNKKRNSHPLDGYTREEDAMILDMADNGRSLEDISSALGRPVGGVRYRLKRLRRDQDDLRKLLESPPLL